MTMPHNNPAQRHFVHQLIDWDRVEERRKRYPAIGRTFPLDILRKYEECSPYYCHYMAWRLGTWGDDSESSFQLLEELLCCAEALNHWDHEKESLVKSADFGTFWSLVWQLQVAEYLCGIGTEVSWAKSEKHAAPDLTVTVDGEPCFVECYAYRKSFGLFLFLQEELLLKIDPSLRACYDLWQPFQLPQKPKDQTLFLDTILSPFLDPTYLMAKKEEVKKQYPVLLYKDPNSSLHVYVDGDGSGVYNPLADIPEKQCGEKKQKPKPYPEVALQEAVNAKQNKNNLAQHCPNLVAVNYALSSDYQLASHSPSPFLNSGPNIDVLTGSAVGINERLTKEKLKVKGINNSRQVNRVALNRIVEIPGS